MPAEASLGSRRHLPDRRAKGASTAVPLEATTCGPRPHPGRGRGRPDCRQTGDLDGGDMNPLGKQQLQEFQDLLSRREAQLREEVRSVKGAADRPAELASREASELVEAADDRVLSGLDHLQLLRDQEELVEIDAPAGASATAATARAANAGGRFRSPGFGRCPRPGSASSTRPNGNAPIRRRRRSRSDAGPRPAGWRSRARACHDRGSEHGDAMRTVLSAFTERDAARQAAADCAVRA